MVKISETIKLHRLSDRIPNKIKLHPNPSFASNRDPEIATKMSLNFAKHRIGRQILQKPCNGLKITHQHDPRAVQITHPYLLYCF